MSWFGRYTSHAAKPDLEMGSKQTTCMSHMQRFLMEVFDLEAPDLVTFPGLQAYCQHLEAQFKPLLSPSYTAMWLPLLSAKPCETSECWALLHLVAVCLKTVNQEASVDDIWRSTCVPDAARTMNTSCSTVLDESQAGPDTEHHPLIAVFSALCWITMMLQPVLYWITTRLSTKPRP